MGFKTAIDTCLRRKYLDFSGRASRSEYWYYILAYLIGSIVVSLVGGILGARAGSVLSGIYSLALFLPSLAVLVRRLHDTNHSGWWAAGGCVLAAAAFIILIGALLMGAGASSALMMSLGVLSIVYGLWMLFLLVSKGTVGPNRYGADPLETPADV